jgi:hypothetical protein
MRNVLLTEPYPVSHTPGAATVQWDAGAMTWDGGAMIWADVP